MPPQFSAASAARMLGNAGRLFHIHDTSSTASMRLPQEVQNNVFLAPDGSNLAAFLYQLRHTYQQHFNLITNAIRTVVPYFHDFVLVPDETGPSPRVMLRWRDMNPDYVFGPHLLSDGTLRSMALITLLMQPVKLLPAMILIDEPELGLHPSVVSLIGSLIKAASDDCQLIVATQSPRLLKEFVPERT